MIGISKHWESGERWYPSEFSEIEKQQETVL